MLILENRLCQLRAPTTGDRAEALNTGWHARLARLGALASGVGGQFGLVSEPIFLLV